MHWFLTYHFNPLRPHDWWTALIHSYHCRCVTWASRRLISSTPRLFVQPLVLPNIKVSIRWQYYWSFVNGIYRWSPVSLHKGPVMRKVLPCHRIIMTLTWLHAWKHIHHNYRLVFQFPRCDSSRAGLQILLEIYTNTLTADALAHYVARPQTDMLNMFCSFSVMHTSRQCKTYQSNKFIFQSNLAHEGLINWSHQPVPLIFTDTIIPSNAAI